MPFYSIVLNYQSSWTGEDEGPHNNRNLVITPDRATADLLFRVIQDNPRNLTTRVSYDEVRRISPQMWSWSAPEHNDYTGLQHAIVDINRGQVNCDRKHLEKLRGKVTLDYIGDWTKPLPIIPHLDVADHISGHHFCIRNKRATDQFWAYPEVDEKKPVLISTTRRAKFRLRAVGVNARDKETLMVDTDMVSLELVYANRGGVEYWPVNLDRTNGLLRPQRRGNPDTFTFGSLFRGGFSVDFFRNEPNKLFPFKAREDSEGGELWELC